MDVVDDVIHEDWESDVIKEEKRRLDDVEQRTLFIKVSRLGRGSSLHLMLTKCEQSYYTYSLQLFLLTHKVFLTNFLFII